MHPRGRLLVCFPTLLGLAVLATGGGSLARAATPNEIVIPGQGIYPESLTSTADGSVIIGSIGTHTIFKAPPGAATAAVFIAAGTGGVQSVFGVFADERANTLQPFRTGRGLRAPFRTVCIRPAKRSGEGPLPTAVGRGFMQRHRR